MPVLKEGDCWTYETRPGEEGSFLVIRKIETSPEGEVVHISIFGLRIKSSTASNGSTDRIQHLPIFARALRASLKEKVQRQFQKSIGQEAIDPGQKLMRVSLTNPSVSV